MIEAMRTLAEVCFSWLLVAQLASLLTASLFPILQKAFRRTHPRNRALGLLSLGLTGPVVGAWVVALYMHPTMASVFLSPHCHQAQCGPHAPLITEKSVVGASMAFAAMVALGVFFAWSFGRLQRVRHQLITLESLTHQHSKAGSLPFRVVESTAPFAWCGGLWKPTIFVSTGLLKRVNREQLNAVLLHEFCHVKRGDNLRKSALYLATLLWPSRSKMRIKKDFNAATEEICDFDAAERLNSKALVADTLELLQHEMNHSARRHQSAFTSNEIEQRLTALKSNPHHDSVVPGWLFMISILISEGLLFTLISHPILEWLAH